MQLRAVTKGKVEDFLETILSKHTRKNHVNGIKKFEKFYGNSIATLIKNPGRARSVANHAANDILSRRIGNRKLACALIKSARGGC